MWILETESAKKKKNTKYFIPPYYIFTLHDIHSIHNRFHLQLHYNALTALVPCHFHLCFITERVGLDRVKDHVEGADS